MEEQQRTLSKALLIKITSSNDFKELVEKTFSDLLFKRANRPTPKQGFRYRKDWYDRLQSNGNNTSKFVLNNIVNVALNTSSLAPEDRDIVWMIGERCINKTIIKRIKMSHS